MKRFFKRSLLVLLLLLSVLLAGLAGTLPAGYLAAGADYVAAKRQGHYLLTNVQILDVDQGILNDGHVEIADGKIKAIFSSQDKLPTDVQQIDGQRQYLLPGLIDLHVHLFDQHDLYANLRFGITTIRNMMGFPVHLRWREAINQGQLLGPRLLTASPTLNAGEGGGPFHKKVHSPEQVVELVNQYQQEGYDLIKFYDGLTQPQFSALAEAADLVNMPIAGHAPSSFDFSQVLAAKPVSLEHVEEMLHVPLDYEMSTQGAQALARQLASSGVPIIPTRIAFHNVYAAGIDHQNFMQAERLSAINPFVRFIGERMLQEATHPDHIKYLKEKEAFMDELMRIFAEQGVTLAMGTDTGPGLTVPGRAMHEELALYQQAGLSNLKILQMATTEAANVLQIEELQGRIRPGETADLLLTRDNPLTTLQSIASPAAVVSQGQYLDAAQLSQLEALSQQHNSFYSTLGLFLQHLLSL